MLTILLGRRRSVLLGSKVHTKREGEVAKKAKEGWLSLAYDRHVSSQGAGLQRFVLIMRNGQNDVEFS